MLCSNTENCIFIIKPLEKTPLHYPKELVSQGNIQFFFSLETHSRLIWQIMHEKQFTTVFGSNATLKHAKELIGTEVGVLVLFNPDNEITLNCLGIGLQNSIPILFKSALDTNEMESHAKVAMLEYKLSNRSNNKNTTGK